MYRKKGVSISDVQIQVYTRHKNIVWLLGRACNRNIKLLFFDYIPNESLSLLLHDAETTNLGVIFFLGELIIEI